MENTKRIEKLQAALLPLRKALIDHPLYSNIEVLKQLQVFTKYHVFAVWDFMSLLKSLQQKLSCTAVPWLPPANPEASYLINEMVLGEESDVDQDGNRISHFKLYLQAMQQMGSNTTLINAFIQLVLKGCKVKDALLLCGVDERAAAFVRHTFSVIEQQPVHVQAAVFTFGREDLVPGLFISLVNEMHNHIPEKVSIFKYYLERHIEVDGDHHSILAKQMVSGLCGDDDKKWLEATNGAIAALEQRLMLWDFIYQKINTLQKKSAGYLVKA